MSKGIIRYMTLLCCLLILATVGGVFATWNYAYEEINDAVGSMGITLSEFVWQPEEILPELSEIGENHLKLIDLILNENSKGYGLNYDNKQVLESYLNSEGIIFSNQKTSGGNIKFVSDETDQLYYCVEKISETVYYAYTFADRELAAAQGTNNSIVAYRTVLEKTDQWRATRSYAGYARIESLSSMGASNMSGTLNCSIDVSTWVSG